MSHSIESGRAGKQAHGIENGLTATQILDNIKSQGEQPVEVSLKEKGTYTVGYHTLNNSQNQEDFELSNQKFTKSPKIPKTALARADKLIHEMRYTSAEDQHSVKLLLQKELFPEFKTSILKTELSIKDTEHTVKPQISELKFLNILETTNQLIKDSQALNEHANTRINLIAGKSAILNSKAPEYEATKKEAISHFKDYEPLYNHAVDMLSNMREKEKEIDSLQKLTDDTINQFIATNNKHKKYFENRFNGLHKDHGFVDDLIKYGYETHTSRYVGVPDCVTVPEAKKATSDELSQSKVDWSANFSDLFLKINVYYFELKLFVDDLQGHISVVAGARKGWDENNPYHEKYKSNASLLPQDYTILAEKCPSMYTTLHNYNLTLEGLKDSLAKNLTDKKAKIKEARQLMVDTFVKYAEESKTLDRKINNNTLVRYKEIRILAESTTEKYPTKEKEEQKEVNKEVLL